MSHFSIKSLTLIGLALYFCGFSSQGFVELRAEAPAKLRFAENDFKTFEELLEFYKKHPQVYLEVTGSATPFPAIDPKVLRRLSEEVLLARYRKFNKDFRDFNQQERVLGAQVKKLESDMEKMPLSDTQNRSLQELKTESLRGKMQQNRKILVMLSVQANESVREALATLSPEQRVVKAAAEVPRMPGVFGGSGFDRQQMKEIDKLNLTPVDPEFYTSQLGQKLEQDLGGRAQFWSYDYGRDELYVKVNDELGKLSVFKDTSGTRFIRTRVGSEFMDPKGRDEKVDLLKARGKFLTGNPTDESLFGDFPKNSPSYIDESKKPHSGSGGTHHDHNH